MMTANRQDLTPEARSSVIDPNVATAPPTHGMQLDPFLGPLAAQFQQMQILQAQQQFQQQQFQQQQLQPQLPQQQQQHLQPHFLQQQQFSQQPQFPQQSHFPFPFFQQPQPQPQMMVQPQLFGFPLSPLPAPLPSQPSTTTAFDVASLVPFGCYNLLHTQLATQNTNMHAETRRLQECVDLARRQEDDVSARFVALDQAHTQLKAAMAEAAEATNVQQQLLAARVATLEGDVDRVQVEKQQAVTTLEVEKEQAIMSLRLQLQKAIDRCIDLDDVNRAEMKDTIERNRQTVQAVRDRESTLRSSLKDCQAKHGEELKRANAEASLATMQHEAYVERTQAECEKTQRDYAAQRATLQKELDEMRVKCVSVDAELVCFHKSESALIAQAREELDSVRTENQRLHQQNQDAELQHAELVGQIARLKDELVERVSANDEDEQSVSVEKTQQDDAAKIEKRQMKQQKKKQKKQRKKNDEAQLAAFSPQSAGGLRWPASKVPSSSSSSSTKSTPSISASDPVTEQGLREALCCTVINNFKHRGEIHDAHIQSDKLLQSIHQDLLKWKHMDVAIPEHGTRDGDCRDFMDRFLCHYRQERQIVLADDFVQKECVVGIAQLSLCIVQHAMRAHCGAAERAEFEVGLLRHLRTLAQGPERQPYSQCAIALGELATTTAQCRVLPDILSGIDRSNSETRKDIEEDVEEKKRPGGEAGHG